MAAQSPEPELSPSELKHYKVSFENKQVHESFWLNLREELHLKIWRSESNLAYHFIRLFIYFASFVVYVVAVAYDDLYYPTAASPPRLFHFDSEWPLTGVINYIGFAFISAAFVDTILRSFASNGKQYFGLLKFEPVVNITLFVLACIRLSPNYNTIWVPHFLHFHSAILSVRDLYRYRSQWWSRRANVDGQVYWGNTKNFELVVLFSQLFVTFTCVIEHAERGCGQFSVLCISNLQLSVYFFFETITTVGYGDTYPQTWTGRVVVILLMISVVAVFLPQLTKMLDVWKSMKFRGTFKVNRSASGHIVLIGDHLDETTVQDCLFELREANPEREPPFLVILSSTPRTFTLARLLRNPYFAGRCKYLLGNALNTGDLARAAVQNANAVFLVGQRLGGDLRNSDQQTVLRAWAVSDFAPQAKLFVQVELVETIHHLSFVHSYICIDELRYAFWAANCLHVGVGTALVSLLHTVNDASIFDSATMQDYATTLQSEIYEVVLKDSKLFSEYQGETFQFAAYHSFSKLVCLIAVKTKNEEMKINPGSHHIMQADDVCFYISRSQEQFMIIEENHAKKRSILDMKQKSFRTMPNRKSTISQEESIEILQLPHHVVESSTPPPHHQQQEQHESQAEATTTESNVASEHHRRAPTIQFQESQESQESNEHDDIVASANVNKRPLGQFATSPSIKSRESRSEFVKIASNDSQSDFLYVGRLGLHAMYCGSKPVSCWLIKRFVRNQSNNQPQPQRRTDLRLSWAHLNNLKDGVPFVVIVVSTETIKVLNGLFHLITCLRAPHLDPTTLKPLVFLLRELPSIQFASFMGLFPEVYFSVGSYRHPNDFLRSLVVHTETMLFLSDQAESTDEDDCPLGYSDGYVLISAQNAFEIHRTSTPKKEFNIFVELVSRSNMRFMKFEEKDFVSAKGTEDASYFMFRPAFLAGRCLSSSMFSTLLWQAAAPFRSRNHVELFQSMVSPSSDDVSNARLASHILTADFMQNNNIATYGQVFRHLIRNHDILAFGLLAKNRTVVSNSDTRTSFQPSMEFVRNDIVFTSPKDDFAVEVDDVVFCFEKPKPRQSYVVPSKSFTFDEESDGVEPAYSSHSIDVDNHDEVFTFDTQWYDDAVAVTSHSQEAESRLLHTGYTNEEESLQRKHPRLNLDQVFALFQSQSIKKQKTKKVQGRRKASSSLASASPTTARKRTLIFGKGKSHQPTSTKEEATATSPTLFTPHHDATSPTLRVLPPHLDVSETRSPIAISATTSPIQTINQIYTEVDEDTNGSIFARQFSNDDHADKETAI